MAAVVSTRITRLQAVSPRVATALGIQTEQILAGANIGTKIGTITWDASGNVTGGTGMAITANGLIVAVAGVLVGYIDLSGNISMSGPLSSIGGFDIGADFIRDAANSMGLASTVTGADDVRFWAGDTFANRASAPFRVTESGAIVATNLVLSPQSAPGSPQTGRFYMNSDGSMQYWTGVGWATFITTVVVLPPTLSMDAAAALSVSVGTSAPAVVGPYTATPPNHSMDTAVPGVSVSAHSP